MAEFTSVLSLNRPLRCLPAPALRAAGQSAAPSRSLRVRCSGSGRQPALELHRP